MRQFPARFPSRRRQSPLSPFGRTGGTVGEKFCSCFVPNARLGSMAYVESAYRGVVMTRVMLRIALLALLLTPRAAAAQDLRECAGAVRFLRSVAVVVAIVLCRGGRAEHPLRNGQCAMRATTLFLRRPRAVAAI